MPWQNEPETTTADHQASNWLRNLHRGSPGLKALWSIVVIAAGIGAALGGLFIGFMYAHIAEGVGLKLLNLFMPLWPFVVICVVAVCVAKICLGSGGTDSGSDGKPRGDANEDG